MQKHQISVSVLDTLYLGGGTPSLGKVDYIRFLNQFLKDNQITFSGQYEWTVECNPDSLTEKYLEEISQLGVNRFSLGVQSLDSTLFKYLDRVHSLDDSYRALEILKQAKPNFTADLMLGLPRPKGYQRDIKREIDQLIDYGVRHISLYILKVPASYKYAELLPEENEAADEYLLVAKTLKDRGFAHYEVSNFAKEGFKSVHNMQYWQHQSVLALGPSATGFFGSQKMRYKWKVDSSEYVLEQLNSEQMKLEKLFLMLRTNTGINVAEFFDPGPIDDLIGQWEKRQLCHFKNGQLSLTSTGFLVIDSLIDELFSHKLL